MSADSLDSATTAMETVFADPTLKRSVPWVIGQWLLAHACLRQHKKSGDITPAGPAAKAVVVPPAVAQSQTHTVHCKGRDQQQRQLISLENGLPRWSWDATGVLDQGGFCPASVGHLAFAIGDRQGGSQSEFDKKIPAQWPQVHFSGEWPVEADERAEFTPLMTSPEFELELITDPLLQGRFCGQNLESSGSEQPAQFRFRYTLERRHQGRSPQRPISGNCSVSFSESAGQI